MRFSSYLYTKIKQLRRLYFQRITDVKNHIERHGTVGGFNAAHMRAAYIHALGQLALRKTAVFAVICNIQPEASVFGKLIVSHALTL